MHPPGGRSSGKSRTLDQIHEFGENVKYIKQFELIETNPEKEAERFNEKVGKKQQEDGDKYLRQFRSVIDDIKNTSLQSDEKRVEEYVSSLLKSASETERQDLYSKSKMFTETEFQVDDSEKLKTLILAAEALLSPGKYIEIVEAKISRTNLVKLLHELVAKYREESLTRRKLLWQIISSAQLSTA